MNKERVHRIQRREAKGRRERMEGKVTEEGKGRRGRRKEGKGRRGRREREIERGKRYGEVGGGSREQVGE